MKITIDLDELTGLIAEGEKIFLKPEAEMALLKILEAEEAVATIKDQAKARLLELANELNPNFKSLSADNLRLTCRAYGAKFYIEEDKVSEVAPELYKREVTLEPPTEEEVNKLMEAGMPVKKVARTVDTKAVEKFVKEHRGMPFGIGEYPEDKRPKQLSFSKKGGKDE